MAEDSAALKQEYSKLPKSAKIPMSKEGIHYGIEQWLLIYHKFLSVNTFKIIVKFYPGLQYI